MAEQYLPISVKRYLKKIIYATIVNAKETDREQTHKEAMDLYKEILILFEK